MMKRFLVALTVLVSLGVPSVARADDSLCFMKTSSGRVVNLGAACGEEQASSSQVDAAFLENYRQLVDDPIALRMVSTTKGQDWALRMARNYCQGRREGLSRAQMMSIYVKGLVQAKNEGNSERAVRANRDAIAAILVLAPTHYCSEFARMSLVMVN